MAEATDDRLRLLVERIERLREEARGIAEDIKDVFSEAKAVGYDVPTLRRVLARRAMAPDARAEADLLVETYEAALGGLCDDPALDPAEAQRELAVAVLAEQLDGVADPVQAAMLVEHVTVLLDIRAEIALLREQEGARRNMAKGEGFLPRQLAATVRWIEQCAKHGPENVRAGEAVFHLYRGTVDARGAAPAGAVSADPALEAKFGRGAAAARKQDAAVDWWLQSGMGN